MDELTIKIWESENEPGHFYEVYDTLDVTDETESIEGGFCTTTMGNALEMACDGAWGKFAGENLEGDIERYVDSILDLINDTDLTEDKLREELRSFVKAIIHSR